MGKGIRDWVREDIWERGLGRRGLGISDKGRGEERLGETG